MSRVRFKILITALFATIPVARAADDPLRYESCLLGQETAMLFYEMLSSEPDRAERILEGVDTRIGRRAFYWAMVYVEQGRSLDELSRTYLDVCMRTGPVKIPAPQL